MDSLKLLSLFVFFACFISVSCIRRGCGSKFTECDIGEWQPWERCNASCGGGFRQRQKPICCDVNQVKSLDECITRCNLTHEEFTNATSEVGECGTRCYNRGVFNASTYSCDCINGTWGQCCRQQENECRSNPCHHGRCMDQLFSYRCSCYAGYSGKLCETGVCDNFTCGNNSHCVPSRKLVGGRYTYVPYCSCLPGFNGKDCSNHYCDTFDCQNNGTCYNRRTYNYRLRLYLNGPGCRCESGYYGTHCEFINRCVSNPCLNRGRCYMRQSNFTCRCMTCYSGDICETYTPDNTTRCPPLTTYISTVSTEKNTKTTSEGLTQIVTLDGSTETVSSSSSVKVASRMSTATSTITTISSRHPSPMQTTTALRTKSSTVTTTTLRPPTIKSLSIASATSQKPTTSPTTTSPSALKRTTVPPQTTYQIKRTPIKHPSSTQVPLKIWFTSNPTVSNSMPYYLTFGGTTSKYSVLMQTAPYPQHIQVNQNKQDIGQCLQMPCVSGRCIPITNGYYCNCYPGYEGTNCQKEINECEKDQCMHGKCIDQLNSFECECNFLYTGPTCNKMKTWSILTIAAGLLLALLLACCCYFFVPSCLRRKKEEKKTNSMRKNAWM